MFLQMNVKIPSTFWIHKAKIKTLVLESCPWGYAKHMFKKVLFNLLA